MEKRSEWAALLEIENERERRKELEAYLDKGNGSSYLRRSDLADIVEQSLRLFHAKRYALKAWVIMPNHVHVLVEVTDTPIARIVKDWKSCTAHQANGLIGRKGPFWAPDYWDLYMRSEEHKLRTQRYIEGNPVKALLVGQSQEWPWSSARYRDITGLLRI